MLARIGLPGIKSSRAQNQFLKKYRAQGGFVYRAWALRLLR